MLARLAQGSSAGQADSLLGTTMRQLDSMVAAGGGSNICLLVAFIVCTFVLVYFFVLR